MSEVEIRDERKTQGVVEVHRVTVKKEGKVIPTNTLFLTFNRPDVPKLVSKLVYEPSQPQRITSELKTNLVYLLVIH